MKIIFTENKNEVTTVCGRFYIMEKQGFVAAKQAHSLSILYDQVGSYTASVERQEGFNIESKKKERKNN